jgi:flagellar L-ring protein precursor FlgH
MINRFAAGADRRLSLPLRHKRVGVRRAVSMPPCPCRASAPTEGAIFIAAAGYAPLVSGARAQRVGDVLTIILSESTSTAKTSTNKTHAPAAPILPHPRGPLSNDLRPLNASSSGSFNGQGNATQTNSFNGMISVTIAEVRPNGTALVRGEKRMAGQGRSGSSFRASCAWPISMRQPILGQVADARIEYAGDGAMAQRAARRLAVEILQLHQPVLRTPMRIPSFLAALVALASTMMAPVAHAERVRDIGTFSGVRSNH